MQGEGLGGVAFSGIRTHKVEPRAGPILMRGLPLRALHGIKIATGFFFLKFA